MIIAFFTLLTALTLSSVAAYYSIVGLTAIFAAAVLPIMIMGGVLEISKIVTTVWLHKNWPRTPILMKSYLTFAVIMLMFITSMGIFGFLSKAHMDQIVAPGDNTDKVQIIDQRIIREQDQIKRAQANISILDQQINKYTQLGAVTKGIKAREKQKPERDKIYKIIEASQNKISNLREEKIPLTKEIRSAEAEVGPLKYIAALIYGNHPSHDILDKAVRWVIIILVSVFDPLAIIMIVAANKSIMWSSADRRRRQREKQEQEKQKVELEHRRVLEEEEFQIEMAKYKNEEVGVKEENIFPGQDIVVKLEPEIPEITDKNMSDTVALDNNNVYHEINQISLTQQADSAYNKEWKVKKPAIKTDEEHELKKANMTLVDINAELANKVDELEKAVVWLSENQKSTTKPTADVEAQNIPFGTKFPSRSVKNDIFLRVDYLPTKLFKYNGGEWEEIDKSSSDNYAFNDEYIKHLVEKVSKGEYDPDLLSDAERIQIADALQKVEL